MLNGINSLVVFFCMHLLHCTILTSFQFEKKKKPTKTFGFLTNMTGFNATAIMQLSVYKNTFLAKVI